MELHWRFGSLGYASAFRNTSRYKKHPRDTSCGRARTVASNLSVGVCPNRRGVSERGEQSISSAGFIDLGVVDVRALISVIAKVNEPIESEPTENGLI